MTILTITSTYDKVVRETIVIAIVLRVISF